MRGIRSDKIRDGAGDYPQNFLTGTARIRGGCGGGLSISRNKSVKQAMDMHLNHMYLDCLDSKASLTKEVEVKNLKELVLLHLDLIQQQRDELTTKDRIIKDLKKENESVSLYL